MTQKKATLGDQVFQVESEEEDHKISTFEPTLVDDYSEKPIEASIKLDKEYIPLATEAVTQPVSLEQDISLI